MDPTTRPKRADEMNRSDDDDDDYEAAKPLSAGPDGNECADDDGSTERRPDETDERNNSPSPIKSKKNSREARREHDRMLTKALNKLRCVLPTSPLDVKMTKIETLKSASNYILALSRILTSDDSADPSHVHQPFESTVGDFIVYIGQEGNKITLKKRRCNAPAPQNDNSQCSSSMTTSTDVEKGEKSQEFMMPTPLSAANHCLNVASNLEPSPQHQ